MQEKHHTDSVKWDSGEFRLDPMFTAVNSKGSGESGTVHTRIRIPYVFIKSCCVQLLKIAI